MNLLTQDLTNVDISRPVLEKGGPLRFTLTDLKVEKSKDQKKDMLVFTFKSKYQWRSTKGDQISPGFTITDRLVLTPSERQTEDRIMQSLARRKSEILGTQGGNFMPLEQYIGKEVDAMIDIEEDTTGEYGPQNRLRKLQPAT